jgi:hypothetical protein
MSMTLRQLERDFATEEQIKTYLAGLRWPDGKVICPRCGGTEKVYKLGKPWTWLCKAKAENHGKSGYRFTILVGTVFENTNVPLVTWFKVMYAMMQSKKGISALQVSRMIGKQQLGKGTHKGSEKGKGSYRTAWYMCQRIRAAMQNDEFLQITGEIEMDETYVGGKEGNKHRRKRLNKRGGVGGKTGVIGAISRKGNVTAQVIEHLDIGTVSRFVHETVSPAVTLVATDQAPVYDRVAWGPLRSHQSVDHSKGEYVRGHVHTANLDAFWSLLKRGVMGTFHQVSKKYLPLYVNEFAFRHNHRNDPEMFRALCAGC